MQRLMFIAEARRCVYTARELDLETSPPRSSLPGARQGRSMMTHSY